MNKKEQQRLARAAERAATIQARGDAWRARVEEYFAYLQNKYGFELTQVKAEDWWTIRVIYQTSISAVYVDFNIEYQAVEVTLVRLLDGELPSYPLFSKPDNICHQFVLTDLLRIRASHLVSKAQKTRGLGDEQVEESLKLFAQTLEEYAADFLRGDFSLFVALNELIHKRVQGQYRRKLEKQDIPSPLQFEFTGICRSTDGFCETYLDDKLAHLCRQAVKALCQQDPSPLSNIRFNRYDAWACGILHAICEINHLFDNERFPSLSESSLAEYFKLSEKTMQTKSKQIRKLLKIDAESSEWKR